MKEETKNSNCIKNNVLLRSEFVNEEGERIEFFQAPPSIEATESYQEISKLVRSDDDYVEAEVLGDALLSTEDIEKKIEYRKRINNLNKSLDAKYNKSEQLNNLVKATFEGTDYQKGKFLSNGKEAVLNLVGLPALTHDKLQRNAINLITIKVDELKN